MKRHRQIFGKVRVNVGGKPCVVRMTKTRLEVRPLHGRRVYWLPLPLVALNVMADASLQPPPHPNDVPPIITNLRGPEATA